MIELRKYIAFILFGIFFFPVTFQPVHVLWHHAHGYEGEGFFIEKSFNKKNGNLSSKVELCLIGEYKFLVNDLPKKSTFSFIVPVVKYFQKGIVKQQQYKKLFSEKSTRAPPSLIS